MTRRTIGGSLGLQALAMLHQPTHRRALIDARHTARQSLAALQAIDPAQLSDNKRQVISRCAGFLRAVVDQLSALEHRA